MPCNRDVRAFDERAASYESGMLGQLHRDISGRVADLALSLGPAPRRVLADQFSLLLWPTLFAGRRGKARTRARATRLVTAAGLRSPRWHRVYGMIIQAVTAVR
jgi:hypothetical protein